MVADLAADQLLVRGKVDRVIADVAADQLLVSSPLPGIVLSFEF
ncbi:hypothetical protein [Limnofasciculus baicalensis]|nr:hypothetical protein [Limnofasciculus baicalensis]